MQVHHCLHIGPHPFLAGNLWPMGVQLLCEGCHPLASTVRTYPSQQLERSDDLTSLSL